MGSISENFKTIALNHCHRSANTRTNPSKNLCTCSSTTPAASRSDCPSRHYVPTYFDIVLDFDLPIVIDLMQSYRRFNGAEDIRIGTDALGFRTGGSRRLFNQVIGVTFHRRCSVTPPCRVEGGFLRHRPWARTTRLGAGRKFTRIGSPV